MRVLHILNELKYSGAEIMYVDAAQVFQKLGCELMVVNTMPNLGDFSPAFKEAGYQVFHMPYPARYSILERIRWHKSMMSLLKDNHVDQVHIHAARLRGSMSYLAWRAGVPCVYTFHNVFKSKRLWGYIYGWIQRKISKNIFQCRFQTISDSVYANELHYWHNKTTLIYNWYGKSRFYPATDVEKLEARNKLNIAINDLVIISVGGCSDIKRHTDVIKALPTIIEKKKDVVYLHLGEGESLEEEKKLARELGVDVNIRFVGNKRNVRDYLIASDVYVMPSKHEGIPITTIEAMACKIPCVLYDVPGLRDFNKEADCCCLIPESYEILSRSVLDLYENKDLQTRLVDNAYNFINKFFDMEKNAESVYKLYQGK